MHITRNTNCFLSPKCLTPKFSIYLFSLSPKSAAAMLTFAMENDSETLRLKTLYQELVLLTYCKSFPKIYDFFKLWICFLTSFKQI